MLNLSSPLSLCLSHTLILHPLDLLCESKKKIKRRKTFFSHLFSFLLLFTNTIHIHSECNEIASLESAGNIFAHIDMKKLLHLILISLCFFFHLLFMSLASSSVFSHRYELWQNKNKCKIVASYTINILLQHLYGRIHLKLVSHVNETLAPFLCCSNTLEEWAKWRHTIFVILNNTSWYIFIFLCIYGKARHHHLY